MTLSKQTILLGIDEAKITAIQSDENSGSDPTYEATGYNVPGIQKIGLAPSYTEKGLKGDEKILDYYINLDFIQWEFHSAKISLDVLAILEGGSITPSGTTPNQVNTYSVSTSSAPKYFKIEGKTNYSAGEVGDFHFILYKCKANSVQVEFSTQDYAIVSASGIAIPTANGKIKNYIINETATAIS